MHPDTQILRDQWIREAEVLLGMGKGHLGVINMLRASGMSTDMAKRTSFDIFDQAKIKLLKSQRLERCLAWLLITAGILAPVAMYIAKLDYYVFSIAPIGAGYMMLTKLPNPSRLPEALPTPE
ncbi:hypothetical protein HW115_12705 [Verrucomicrobiaceae bacterium N1E253]|uniref:Uncharacterized protein n=1 Tax=Oceaniferula marina TaxID=2748318 RepID=A0A851GMV9_9BACT|nr:hypothetical protein [Oceaniferula marina]NWK56475.1 hypothetical protein [Oceaniferula marina]